MSFDETDLIERLHAVAEGFEMPPTPMADDVGRGRRRMRRNRVLVAGATAAVVAFIAVGGGLAAGTLGGSDRLSPIGEPTTPSPSPTMAQQSAEPSPGSDEFIENELRKILTQVPNWTISNNDPTDIRPCAGDWAKDDTGGGGGNVILRAENESPYVMVAVAGFPSRPHASDAAASLVENLASCTFTAWRTQPIARTGAVLASSADGVVWIQQKGAMVETLQAPTTDGPPPLDLQIEVAEWMVADMIHSQQD